MNRFFEKKKIKRNWPWKSPSGTKNEIYIMITNRHDIVKGKKKR